MHPSLLIRAASAADRAAIWAILEPIIRDGETYALPRDMGEADAIAYWTGPSRQVFVAEADGVVVGTYFLRGNQLGGGDHVANAAYATDPAQRGRGIARKLAEHSLAEAGIAGSPLCNSISWSAPMPPRSIFGKALALRPSAGCLARFGIRNSAASTPSSCRGSCSLHCHPGSRSEAKAIRDPA